MCTDQLDWKEDKMFCTEARVLQHILTWTSSRSTWEARQKKLDEHCKTRGESLQLVTCSLTMEYCLGLSWLQLWVNMAQ